MVSEHRGAFKVSHGPRTQIVPLLTEINHFVADPPFLDARRVVCLDGGLFSQVTQKGRKEKKGNLFHKASREPVCSNWPAWQRVRHR